MASLNFLSPRVGWVLESEARDVLKEGMDISCVRARSASVHSHLLHVGPLWDSREDSRAHTCSRGLTTALHSRSRSLQVLCPVSALLRRHLPSGGGNACWCSGHSVGEGGLRDCINHPQGPECGRRSVRGPGLLLPDGYWRLPLPVLGI